jgi:CheY-like chemotaxis protein
MAQRCFACRGLGRGDSAAVRWSATDHARHTPGLLASTGLRIGEAIRLTMNDVQLDARPAHLRVLESKFRKSRLVPVDPTTAVALAGYVPRRHHYGYHALSEIFFVNERGDPLDAGMLGCWFGKLTGKAGLRLIQTGVHLDLLISDYGLPGSMNGRQVIDAVHERNPELPAILITGYAGGAQMADLEVIRKPFDPAVLIDRVPVKLDEPGASPRSERAP